MASARAPKQWKLTKTETVNSFENWKQNLLYILSQDKNFERFLKDDAKWAKKTKNNPNRDIVADGNDVPAPVRFTAAQKASNLDMMLGQIANYCPVISRNTIVRNSTSLSSIWQAIRAHFGFQSTGGHFLDLAEFKLKQEERPEDLFQRLTAFFEDNLLTKDCGLKHHDEAVDEDELSPSLENTVVLLWLQMIHQDLPRLVKQRYGTELRSRTLASIKPEISQALQSLLDELSNSEEGRVNRAFVNNNNSRHRPFHGPKHRSKTSDYRPMSSRNPPSCPICKQANRQKFDHLLSS